MKATILQDNFAKALQAVSRVVSNRTTLPVLGNILIAIEDGKICLSATDLEVAVTAKISGKVESEGKITIPARILSDFVLNNSDESLELDLKDLSLNLKSNRYEANIKGIDAEEFPTVPKPSGEVFIEILANDFAESVKKIIIASATDDTRPVLAGVYFKFNGKNLTLAATDSYRLAEKRIALESEVKSKEIIVPNHAMSEIFRLASVSDPKEKIKIIIEENQAFFILGDVQIVSRLIEGSFPNYEQIIPKSLKITAKCKLADALSAIKMSALFARDVANNIKISLTKKELVIKSVAEQLGSTVSKVESEISGGEVEIAFNARYLIDVLSVFPGDEVEFSFNDEASPGLVKSNKEEDYLYLVMPLKIDT